MKNFYVCFEPSNEPEPFVVIGDRPEEVAKAVEEYLKELVGGYSRGWSVSDYAIHVDWHDEALGDKFTIICKKQKEAYKATGLYGVKNG